MESLLNAAFSLFLLILFCSVWYAQWNWITKSCLYLDMSFRADTRETKSRTRLSARDQRLFHQLTGQKKTDEQDSIIEQLEGPRNKTPTKKSNFVPTGPVNKYIQERAELEGKVKKRLKKLQAFKKTKKLKVFGETWQHCGPTRATLATGEWEHLGAGIVKMDSYEGFEPSDTKHVFRLEHGQEHPQR